MPGPIDGFFQEHHGIAERRLGLTSGGVDRSHQVVSSLDAPQSSPASTHGRLHEQREPDVGGRGERRLGCDLTGLFQHWQPGGGRRGLGPHLVATEPQDFGRGPDKRETGGRARPSQLGVLRQESVPG